MLGQHGKTCTELSIHGQFRLTFECLCDENVHIVVHGDQRMFLCEWSVSFMLVIRYTQQTYSWTGNVFITDASWLLCHLQIKSNEWGFRPPLYTYRLNCVLKMVSWMRWHCPADTGFEIRTLVVWGRARSRRLPTILNLSFTAAYVISAIIFIDEKHINKIVKAIQSG